MNWEGRIVRFALSQERFKIEAGRNGTYKYRSLDNGQVLNYNRTAEDLDGRLRRGAIFLVGVTEPVAVNHEMIGDLLHDSKYCPPVSD